MDDDSSLAAEGTGSRSGGLSPAQYAEVKRLFLQAIDLPAAERESFVQQVSTVSPLAPVLVELLSNHVDDLKVTPASGSRIRRTDTSAFRSHPLQFLRSAVRSPIALTLLGTLFAIYGSYLVWSEIQYRKNSEARFLQHVRASHAVQVNDAQAVLQSMRARCQRFTNDTYFRKMTDALQKFSENETARREISKDIRSFLRTNGNFTYVILGKDGKFLAGSDPAIEETPGEITQVGKQLVASMLKNQQEIVGFFGPNNTLLSADPFAKSPGFAALKLVPEALDQQKITCLLLLQDVDQQAAYVKRTIAARIPDVRFTSIHDNLVVTQSLNPSSGILERLVPYRDPNGKERVGIWEKVGDPPVWVVTEFAANGSNVRPLWLLLLPAIPQFLLSAVCFGWAVVHFRQSRRMERDGKLRVGNYTLENVIGYGGMGIVYRARHESLQRPIAVKMMDPAVATPALMERFEREVHLTAKLVHPNTIAIFDFGRTKDGGLFYAMEFLNGMPLSELVQKTGPLPPARVAYFIKQVCASLAEAHGHGLLHRDIKPVNIMACNLGGEGDVIKVLDFGLVKDISQQHTTTVSTLAGTPRYMAPERVWNGGLRDVRVDIYSVGAVAYCLLTGQDIFADAQDESVIYQVVNRVPNPPSKLSPFQIPRAFDELILACLAKNPDDRPSTVQELHTRLESIEFLDTWDRIAAQQWWAGGSKSAGAETVAIASVKTDTVVLENKNNKAKLPDQKAE